MMVDAARWLILVTLSAAACAEDDGAGGGGAGSAPTSYVLSLTNETLPKALQDYRYLLVEFYAPWCGHCKSLEPEYEAAARLLEEEGSAIRLAKIDATVYMELALKYDVPGYPSLIYFIRNRASMQYNGPRKAGAIAAWVKKKIGPQAATLKEKADVERLKKQEIAVIGFFKKADGPEAAALQAVADKLEKQAFGLTTNAELSKEYGVDASRDSIVLFKKFDEGRADFTGEFTVAAIEAFVKTHSLPLVTEFDPDIAQDIFTSDVKGHMLLFASKTTEAYRQLFENAGQIAAQYRGKILFVVVDADHEDAKGMLDYFGVKKTKLPAYRMVQMVVNGMSKYKAETEDISPQALDSFAALYLAGKVPIYLMSEDLPADWDAKPVKVLVADNYKSVVKDSGKKVLVEYYAPLCGHCQQLAPIWDELGEKFKDAPDLIIAKLDATANEIDGLVVNSYPTIMFFLPGQKEIEYNGPRTLEGLSKFIESDGNEAGAGDHKQAPEDAAVDKEAPHEHEHIEL